MFLNAKQNHKNKTATAAQLATSGTRLDDVFTPGNNIAGLFYCTKIMPTKNTHYER